MKTTPMPTTTAFLVLLATVAGLHAAIIRVSQIPGRADYTNLQTAIDAASAGDTLYIEGSPTSYGDIKVTKRLNLYGPGYFLLENTGLTTATQPASIGTLAIAKDNTTGSDPAGSFFTGLLFGGLVSVGANAIVFKRCRLASTCDLGYDRVNGDGPRSITNPMLLGCYLEGEHNAPRFWGIVNNALIDHCLLRDPDITGNVWGATGTIRNCVIYDGGADPHSPPPLPISKYTIT